MKKISLFLSTPIRQFLETCPEVKQDTLGKAITLPTELMHAVWCDGFDDAKAKEIGDGAWEYFRAGHPKFHGVRQAARKAYRLEAAIRKHVTGDICMEIQMYRKSGKDSFFKIEFVVFSEERPTGGLLNVYESQVRIRAV